MAAVDVDTIQAGVALVTLNRPERLNAIDRTFIDAMDMALDRLEVGEYRVGIVTGAGRGFCAGADLRSKQPWVDSARSALKTTYDAQTRLADQLTRLYELPVPMIAAVNGVAVGGGLAIALHCDIRIGSNAAQFGSAFIKAGFSSMDLGTSYLLPRIVGVGAARELMLTGRVIDAREALRIGLLNRIVTDGPLLDHAVAVAAEVAVNNPYGVWQTKSGLNSALDASSLRHAKDLENRIQVLSTYTGNPAAAAVAHVEKRAAEWDPL